MEEQIVRSIIWARRDAIIDRTHLTKESRKRWIDFAKGTGECMDRYEHAALWNKKGERDTIIAVVFPTESPFQHATRRYGSDARGRRFTEWQQVAEHHAEQARLEPLDWRAEGFDDVRVVMPEEVGGGKKA
jgi:hypothetical protein